MRQAAISANLRNAEAPLHRFVVSRHLSTTGFVPHPWFGNPHLQTIMPAMQLRPRIEWRPWRLELPDGDFINVMSSGSEDKRCSRIAVLVHGIGGLRWAHYLISMAGVLLDQGWSVVAPELRGAGREPNRLARSFHHGDTGDFRLLCRHLRRRFPRASIVAVGWSLGAGVVLKALGEEGAASTVQRAAAISAPYRIRDCADHMARGAPAFYQRCMLAQVKRAMRRKHETVPVPTDVDFAAALDARDFMEFGHAYTAPVNGLPASTTIAPAPVANRIWHQ